MTRDHNHFPGCTEAARNAGVPEPPVVVSAAGPTLTVRFNRPEQHNALTEAMYAEVAAACHQAGSDPALRCLVIRGSPGGAFAAGTDITDRFTSIQDGDDGVAYEQGIQDVLETLLDVPVPTVAVIEGYALGGGLLLAAACDLRVATPQARFGVPIARTLGNCLSQFGYELVADRLGPALALRLLLVGDLVDAAALTASGFVAALVEEADLEQEVGRMTGRLAENSPLTQWAAKRADRIRTTGRGDRNEYVRRCYGSADFMHAVAAFCAHRPPVWRGF